MKNEIHGYKVFDYDWACRPDGGFKQYSCPGRFQESGELEICERGMHFCERLIDCFMHYSFSTTNKVAEVIAHGDVIRQDWKLCTNDLEIVREIPWREVLEMVNIGKFCLGRGNVGNKNMGNRNAGSGNIGDWNAGNGNQGNWNVGHSNFGSSNVGVGNWGSYNSGDNNQGVRNAGDWNWGSDNSGCFNTECPKIRMFDQPSNWTYRNWLDSEAYSILDDMPDAEKIVWVPESEMTDQEKCFHPRCDMAGGYLKTVYQPEVRQKYWDSLGDSQKQAIFSLPNFDKDKFFLCTGIRVDGEEDDKK